MRKHAVVSPGIALVITLSAMVLMTVLILAFFSRSLVNRQVTFSSTSIMKADALARSALEIVSGEIRDEIADPAHSAVNTELERSVYQPLTTEDLLPRPMGLSTPTGSIVKISSDGLAVRPNGAITGSACSISTPSLNGRYISRSRWFGDGGPQLGSQDALPTWLFVTRGIGIKTPTLSEAKDASNRGYVIGRFAYTVYDISGLLDANVAGYPTGISPAEVGLKGSAAYADLAVFGDEAKDFPNWRNATTKNSPSDFNEWATGIERLGGSGSAAPLRAAFSGYRTIVFGDNAVLSRRDLLKNPKASAVANYLTHFSRSANAPSWSPQTDAGGSYNYKLDANSPASSNRWLANVRFQNSAVITHYRDDGSTETYTVAAGAPLLQRRFSLAKLAWLTPDGPKAGISASAISDCFGLRWDAATSAWNYVALNSSSGIKTLAEVSTEHREPNFIELLKAGILSGSIGRSSDNKTSADSVQQLLDGVGDLQLLRIGANILDSADRDNFPTTFTLNYAGIDVPVHGVEDLPYLYGFSAGFVRWNNAVSAATDTRSLQYASAVLKPSLFNPHQTSAALAGSTPSNIRIRIKTGTLDRIGLYGTAPDRPIPDKSPGTPTLYDLLYRDFTGDPTNPSADLTNRPPITIPNSDFSIFRENIANPLDTVNPSDTASLVRTIAAPFNNSGAEHGRGFLLHNYQTEPRTYMTKVDPPGASTYADHPAYPPYAMVSNLLIVLEFEKTPGNWAIYDTLAGNEAFTTNNGLGGITDAARPYTLSLLTTFSPGTNNAAIAQAHMKLDPRTTRFGISQNSRFFPTNPVPTTSSSSTFRSLAVGQPFAPQSSEVFPGFWAEAGKTPWNAARGSNIADRDGITRPADAWINAESILTTTINETNGANVFRNLTDQTRRPVVLQRPFRSVAELGYVFRDSPWKTLSFFDETSADAALLDIFAVSDTSSISGGRVNLNTPHLLVQQSLLSGGGKSPDGTNTFTADAASGFASAYNAFAFTSGGVPTTTMPFTSAALSQFMYSDTAPNSLKGDPHLDNIKYHREAVVRALGDTTQTRTWNLLIDLVAQTGKYPSSATSLGNFVVEGEKRYWLSIAIDRYTGKIIDQQLETASE